MTFFIIDLYLKVVKNQKWKVILMKKSTFYSLILVSFLILPLIAMEDKTATWKEAAEANLTIELEELESLMQKTTLKEDDIQLRHFKRNIEFFHEDLKKLHDQESFEKLRNDIQQRKIDLARAEALYSSHENDKAIEDELEEQSSFDRQLLNLLQEKKALAEKLSRLRDENNALKDELKGLEENPLESSNPTTPVPSTFDNSEQKDPILKNNKTHKSTNNASWKRSFLYLAGVGISTATGLYSYCKLSPDHWYRPALIGASLIAASTLSLLGVKNFFYK